MGLLNYLGGRGSSGYGEGSSRHVESEVGGVTVGGVAVEEEKSWEQPDPSVDNLDTLADPEEGRRVLASCGVKVTRLRSTLTALLVWFVLVSLVRALALTVFEVVTDFNAERGNVENGKV